MCLSPLRHCPEYHSRTLRQHCDRRHVSHPALRDLWSSKTGYHLAERSLLHTCTHASGLWCLLSITHGIIVCCGLTNKAWLDSFTRIYSAPGFSCLDPNSRAGKQRPCFSSQPLSSPILSLNASFFSLSSHAGYLFLYLCISSLIWFCLFTHLRWARVGQWFGPAAQVHPARVRQPAHLPLTHLGCRDLHLHGEQLQGHRRGVRWPRGLGWVCRVRRTGPFTSFLKTHMPAKNRMRWNFIESLFSRGRKNEAAPYNDKAALNSFRYKSTLLCKFGVIIGVFSARSHQETKCETPASHFNWN